MWSARSSASASASSRRSASAALLGIALAAFSAASEDVGDEASKVAAHPLLFAAASLGGLVVNFATNMMLAATSALTLRITSLVRNISVVFVGAAKG